MLYMALHRFIRPLRVFYDLGMGIGWNDVSRAPLSMLPHGVPSYNM